MPNRNNLVFIEPIPILPIFCDGIASVETFEGNLHFTCYMNQATIGMIPVVEHVICSRIIMPASAVAYALPTVVRALPERALSEYLENQMRLAS